MDLDIRYVAGLFDADGHITIGKWKPAANNRRGWSEHYVRYQLLLAISQVHYPLIKKLADQFGGAFHRNDSAHRRNANNRIVYTWKLSSDMAAKMLKTMLPWLVVKKEQAELALKFQEHVNRHKSTRPKPEAQAWLYKEREEMRQQIRHFKLRSYDVPIVKDPLASVKR